MSRTKPTFIVIGGGAAGFFAAINAAAANIGRVILIEGSRRFLTKVKISGGGRCNVTHNLFDPRRLVENYPRGSKQLRGAFHQFQPQDTIDWFGQRGIKLVAETDGRMFPQSNRSQTIIDCFLNEAEQAKVELIKGIKLRVCRHCSYTINDVLY